MPESLELARVAVAIEMSMIESIYRNIALDSIISAFPAERREPVRDYLEA